MRLFFHIGSAILVIIAFTAWCMHNGATSDALWQWFVWGFSGSGFYAGFAALLGSASALILISVVAFVMGHVTPRLPRKQGVKWRTACLFFSSAYFLGLVYGLIGFRGPGIVIAILSCILVVAGIGDFGFSLYASTSNRRLTKRSRSTGG